MDLRQHFALERTLLAYVRTGLALIGIGFVIARFGWLMRELGGLPGTSTNSWSAWFGTALVFAGGISGILSAVAYQKQLDRLNVAMQMKEKPAYLGVAMSLMLAAIGIAMGAYLMLF